MAELIAVQDFDGYPMGTCFYNNNSKITIRMMSRNKDAVIDEAFLRARVEAAWNYRKRTVDISSCRVIFGEADFLPGLVVVNSPMCLWYSLLRWGLTA